MMDEKTIHQRLYEESIDELNKYDRLNFENNLKFYTEGVTEMMSATLTSKAELQTEMIDQCVENLKNMVIGVPEMAEFFGNIRNALALKNIPITTKVYNTALIEKIRPQYLMQISTEITVNIDRFLKESVSMDDIERQYLNDAYLINCKKQMVKTSIPYDLDPKALAKYDASVIVDVNETYITANIIPFLGNVPNYIKETEVLAANTNSSISSAYETVSAVLATVDNLFKDEKISINQYRKLNKYLYKIVRIFMRAVSYLTFAVIKKITIISASIKAYKDLQTKILNYFPEGDDILHESVIDGNFDDIDYGTVVNEVIQNDASILLSLYSAGANRAIDFMTYAYGSDVENPEGLIRTEIESNPYSKVPYDAAKEVIGATIASLNSIRENAKDPAMPCDDIVAKSGLESDIIGRFSSLISKIENTSEYDNLLHSNFDEEDKRRVYFMILHELTDGNTTIPDIVSKSALMFTTFKDLKHDLDHGDVSQFGNIETSKELFDFVSNLEPAIRQLILSIFRALIGRVKSLTAIVTEVENGIADNSDVLNTYGESTDEFDDLLIESTDELNNLFNEIEFKEYLMEYTKVRTFYETGMKVVFEDGLNTSTNPTANKTNTTNTTNTTDKKGQVKEKIQGIIKAIQNFFTKSKKMVQDAVNGVAGKQNYNALLNHRAEIENRNFSSVTINVLPYEKYMSFDKMCTDTEKVTGQIGSLTVDQLKAFKSEADLQGYLFSSLDKTAVDKIKNNGALDTLKAYYKVGTANLELMPYKGAEAKTLTPIMIDYCLDYYNPNGAGAKLSKDMDALSAKCEEKLNSFTTLNLNESTMLEDGENTNQQTTQQQPASQAAQQQHNASTNKPSQKPSVSVGDDGSSKNNNSNRSDDVYEKIKWLSKNVQTFSAAVLGGAKDRNIDYMKILNGIMPRDTKKAIESENQNGGQHQTTDQSQQETQNTNESVNYPFDQSLLFLEKADKITYRIRRFMDDYKYDPDMHSVAIDGKLYFCDLDINNDKITLYPYVLLHKQGRYLSTNAISRYPEIVLDRAFFSLNDDKKRKALLMHEIGHVKLQNAYPDYGNPENARKEIWLDARKEYLVNLITVLLYLNYSGADIKRIIDNLYDKYIDQVSTEYPNNKIPISADNKRIDLFNLAKKYDTLDSPMHISASEIEADAYAIRKTSPGIYKSALREMAKYTKKIKNADPDHLKDLSADVKIRSKAISDKFYKNDYTPFI